MNNDSRKIHFTRINSAESSKKILQLKNSSGELIVWLKGRTVREIYSVIEVLSPTELKVYPVESSLLVNNELLFKFSVGGQNYFSTGKLTQLTSNGYYILDISNDFYKSERRSSYRLQVYPDYDVRVNLEIKNNVINENESNVVDFQTGLTQTGIFKNFLKLINLSNTENQSQYRVQDLSTSGISFIVGNKDKQYFQPNAKVSMIKIIFDNEEFEVLNTRVVYIVEFIHVLRKGLKEFKVGLEFDKVSTSLDSKLGMKIAEILRKNDSNEEFEDFIL